MIDYVKVGDLMKNKAAEVQTGPFGTQLKASEYVEKGVPVINVRNIGFGDLREEKLEYVSEQKARKLKAHSLQKEDIVFGRKGAVERHVYIQDEQENWIQGSDCLRLRFKTKAVCPKYVSYYLLTKGHKDWMENLCSFGATMTSLNHEIISRISIPLPDISIQQRIADILSAYDELIEVNNYRIGLLEDTARQLYKEWFVRLRFPNYEKANFIKGLPEGWEISTCHKFAGIKGGGTPSTANPSYWDGPIKFYTPTDYISSFFCQETEKTITNTGLKNSSTKLFPQYTTFITARGTVGNVGMASEPMAMNQSCFGLISQNPADCFYLFLYTLEMVDFLKQVATGATFDAITLKTFTSYAKPLPAEPIRIEFSQLVKPIFLQIETLLCHNKQLRQTRDRLLPRLISGKLSVLATETALVESVPIN